MGDLNKPDGHSEWVIGNRHVVQPPVLLRRYRGGGDAAVPLRGCGRVSVLWTCVRAFLSHKTTAGRNQGSAAPLPQAIIRGEG